MVQLFRYSDLLWDVQSHLETLFGCLVGSSAYLTPPNTQGLAPHHDDVDVFILQTEGSKKWTLYAPIQVNARTASHDLPRAIIGDPTHEFTLHRVSETLYQSHNCSAASPSTSIRPSFAGLLKVATCTADVEAADVYGCGCECRVTCCTSLEG